MRECMHIHMCANKSNNFLKIVSIIRIENLLSLREALLLSSLLLEHLVGRGGVDFTLH